jgi:uncharacterized membrane protein
VSDRSPVLPAPARGSHPQGVHAHRVIFIDLARALAVVFMLYGHSVDALLDHSYRVGTWFQVWTFQRGLTSSLFLLLSGFAFSIATARHWSSHLRLSRTVLNRVRRFSLFIVLGYALHFPVPKVAELWSVNDERWRSFVSIDILQLIGVSFLFVQLLVLVSRSRRVLAGVAMTLAGVVVFSTPAMWDVDWAARLPLWASSYLEPDTGSLFPLFPWIAYILLGVGLGQLYARWGASNLTAYANRVLLGGGIALIVAGRLLRPYQNDLFGGGPWTYVPPEALLRMGTCLVIMGAIAHGTGYIRTLPRVFGAVAQETLLIYFVHLCIVYGSIWGPGLYQFYGPTLGPMSVLGVILALLASMTALAWQWNWVKHTSPKAARAISIVVLTLLFVRLI